MTRSAFAPWSGPIYLDASAVVKLLLPERGSDELNNSLVGADEVIVSDLSITEVTSALARRVRERTLAGTEARRVHRELMRVADRCLRAELTPPVHRRAERLLLGAAETSLRARDALHVAIAIDAAAATFVTYDRQLHRAATAHGLVAAPVLSP